MPKPVRCDYTFKLVIAGDTKTGKSNLLSQFIDSKFYSQYELTTGVEFDTKICTESEKTIKLLCWDTAGHELFKVITDLQFKNIAACLLVYDVSQKETFSNLTSWLSRVKEKAENDNIKILVVGNKSDLNERVISYEEGKAFADRHDLSFIETSAKTRSNVDEAFNQITREVYEFVAQQPLDTATKLAGITQKQSLSFFTQESKITTRAAETAPSSPETYHRHDENNLIVHRTSAVHEDEKDIELLKKQAIPHILKGEQLNSPSYKRLQSVLTRDQMSEYEDSVKKQIEDLLNSHEPKKDQTTKATPADVYRSKGGTNFSARCSLFLHRNNSETMIKVLKKRALKAIECGNLQSASLQTLSEAYPAALRQLLLELNSSIETTCSPR